MGGGVRGAAALWRHHAPEDKEEDGEQHNDHAHHGIHQNVPDGAGTAPLAAAAAHDWSVSRLDTLAEFYCAPPLRTTSRRNAPGATAAQLRTRALMTIASHDATSNAPLQQIK